MAQPGRGYRRRLCAGRSLIPADSRSKVVLGTRWRQRLFFAALYLSEGGPIGFVWWALPVWLSVDGVSTDDIARVVALAGWPWALKVFWAPAIDLLQSPRFGVRSWILASQVLMALTLVPLLFIDLSEDLDLLIWLLVAHALAASTQDAAIDTLAIRTVPAHERGSLNGWMQVGMLTARAVFGGGAVLLAARIGRPAVVGLLLAAVIVPGCLLLLRSNQSSKYPLGSDVPRSRFGLAHHLRAVLQSPRVLIGLAFATLAGAGFESLAALGGPFLIERGLSEDDVGAFYFVPVVLCMASGALVGGWTADRIGRRRATLIFETLTALIVMTVGIAAHYLTPEHGATPFVLLLGTLYFSAGLTTAALYALLMDQTDKSAAATQFCAFMAGINLCYVWSTRALGYMVEHRSYAFGLCVMAAASLAALPLLHWLPAREAEEQALPTDLQ